MKRTKLGTFFYNLTMRFSRFLTRHIWLWYVLNLTWGLPYTLIGAFMSLFVNLFYHRKGGSFRRTNYKYGPLHVTQFGRNWGGLEGVFFIFVANDMGTTWTEHTRQHEFGHSFQNALFGPFNIFLTLIPSVCRYWYQEFRGRKGKTNKPYDLAWFEGSASDAGVEAVKALGIKASN